MNRFDQALDRHITGNYGEDQFRYGGTWKQMLNQMQNAAIDLDADLSAHWKSAKKHIIHDEYSYDPADDGPEVEIICKVNAAAEPKLGSFISMTFPKPKYFPRGD